MARYEDSTGQRLLNLVTPDKLVGSGGGKVGLPLLRAMAEANPQLFVAEALDTTVADNEIVMMRRRLIELNSVFGAMISVASWEREITQAAADKATNQSVAPTDAASV